MKNQEATNLQVKVEPESTHVEKVGPNLVRVRMGIKEEIVKTHDFPEHTLRTGD